MHRPYKIYRPSLHILMASGQPDFPLVGEKNHSLANINIRCTQFPTVGENNHSSATHTTLCLQNPQLSGKMIYGNPSCSRKITIHQRISTLGIQDTIREKNHSLANINISCTQFPTVRE